MRVFLRFACLLNHECRSAGMPQDILDTTKFAAVKPRCCGPKRSRFPLNLATD